MGQNPYAVFAVRQSEAISYAYERDIDDPRVAHTLNLTFDKYGNALESVSVMYGRKLADATLPAASQAAQARTSITYKVMGFTNDIDTDNAHRAPLPSEERSYELRGVATSGHYYTPGDFDSVATATDVPYEQKHNNPLPGAAQKRLIEHLRTIYYQDDLSGPLPLHQIPLRALPFETYQLAYTPDLLNDIFGTKVNGQAMVAGSYVNSEGDNNWWIRSGRAEYLQAGGNCHRCRHAVFRADRVCKSAGSGN